MLKPFSRLVFKVKGWTYENQIGNWGKKCVMLAAPHTSNWDTIIGLACFEKMGIPVKVAIKDFWFKFPFNKFVEPAGGIPIKRSKEGVKISTVEAMVNLFKEREQLILMITPEGTRSKTTKWRTGFYHVAIQAEVPIVLTYLDYKNKRGVVGKIINPSGNMESDLKEIMAFYKTYGFGKYPEKFSVDKQYA